MARFQAAVFDVDGTLLDTKEGIFTSICMALTKAGLTPPEKENAAEYIGPPLQRIFRQKYHMTPEDAMALADSFREYYKNGNYKLAAPYEGIYRVFETLTEHGIIVSAATYKRQDYAEAILKEFHFDDYTPYLFGADFEGKLMKRDIIENALKASGITDYQNAVMIGDSDNDAVGAAELGIPFIAVTYGFGFHDESDAKKFPHIAICRSPLEIIDVILGE